MRICCSDKGWLCGHVHSNVSHAKIFKISGNNWKWSVISLSQESNFGSNVIYGDRKGMGVGEAVGLQALSVDN